MPVAVAFERKLDGARRALRRDGEFDPELLIGSEWKEVGGIV